MMVEICFVSFKKSMAYSVHVQSLCNYEGFLTYNVYTFHILGLDNYVIKVQTQKFRSFGFVLTLITVFVYFCFNKDVFSHLN